MGDKPQWEVADEIGVSASRISRWLSGGLPDQQKIGLVADWLGVSEADLYLFLRDRHRKPVPRKTATERLVDLEAAVAGLTAEVTALTKALEGAGIVAPRRKPRRKPPR